jgi:hypothetical protein
MYKPVPYVVKYELLCLENVSISASQKKLIFDKKKKIVKHKI